MEVSEDDLQEAAVLSGVLEVANDFIDPAFKQRCENVIPNPMEILPEDCSTAYIRLKENVFWFCHCTYDKHWVMMWLQT